MAIDVHEVGAGTPLNPGRLYGGERSTAYLHEFFRASFNDRVAKCQRLLERQGASIVNQEPTYEHPKVRALPSGHYMVLVGHGEEESYLTIAIRHGEIAVKPYGGFKPLFTHKDSNGIPTVSGMFGFGMEAEGKHYILHNDEGLEVALSGADSTPSQIVGITKDGAYEKDTSAERERSVITLGGCPDTKDELCVLGIIKINYADESLAAAA